jgi:hypothetical protein
MRLPFFAALLGVALVLAPAPLLAQAYTIYAPGIVETPHIHLGSATEPSVVQVPPVVVEQSGLPVLGPPSDDYDSENTSAMYARGEFDYLVAPTGELFPGSMADTSISLGEYAREVRSHKGQDPPPVHWDIKSLPPE